MNEELERRTRYDPAETEPRIFARWEASGLFSPEPEGTAEENYSISIPPPSVIPCRRSCACVRCRES